MKIIQFALAAALVASTAPAAANSFINGGFESLTNGPGQLMTVVDAAGVEAFVRMHVDVFGGDHSAIGRILLAGLSQEHPCDLAVIASFEGQAVGARRVELLPGTEFASIWGGATLPAWRGRGVFRSIVAYRAALAAARGFRYLQVDATPDSRFWPNCWPSLA